MLARLNFATPGADGNVRFVLDNGWSGTNQQPVDVQLEDWRGLARPPGLDREGFLLTRTESGVTNYGDAGQVERLWFPAIRRTVLEATGGSWAVLFAGPNVRFSNRDPNSHSTSVAAPARAVHADLHADFAYADLGRQPLGADAAREAHELSGGREPARWKVFNLWQMISSPPQDNSLALCRLDSIAPEDILPGKGYFDEPGTEPETIIARHGENHQFDLTFFRQNKRQRWGWYSDLEPGDTLVFSAFDPQRPGDHARVAHAAFDVADAGPDAIPRSSIEIRALVAFTG